MWLVILALCMTEIFAIKWKMYHLCTPHCIYILRYVFALVRSTSEIALASCYNVDLDVCYRLTLALGFLAPAHRPFVA